MHQFPMENNSLKTYRLRRLIPFLPLKVAQFGHILIMSIHNESTSTLNPISALCYRDFVVHQNVCYTSTGGLAQGTRAMPPLN
jgi:hypothetical protein